MEDRDVWWSSWVRLFTVLFKPQEVIKDVHRYPDLGYTFSHLYLARTVVSLAVFYLYTKIAVSPTVAEEVFITEAVGGILWMLVSTTVDMLVRGLTVRVWLNLSGIRVNWQWAFSIGALSQVPIVIEEIMRFLLLGQFGFSAPASLSLALLFGQIGTWCAPLLNPFVYWQIYILFAAVRDARPLGLGPKAFFTGMVVLFSILNATGLLVSL